MDNRKLTDEQRALLELILDPSHLEELTSDEVDAELRALGTDPQQEPSWRRPVLTYLERKLASLTAHSGDVERSLVGLEIVCADEFAQLGAAAKHKASKAGPPRRRFALTWTQGEHEWRIEGISSGERHELRLSCQHGGQPDSIAWKNPLTRTFDRYGLKSTKDGHLLVDGISLAKAQKLAEAVQNAKSDLERHELLPIVLMFGEPA